MARPSLLVLMVLVSGAAVVANGVTVAAPLGGGQTNRLGAAIDQDLSERDADAAKASRALNLREAATKAAEARLKAQVEAQQQQQQQAAAAAAAQAAQPPVEEQFDELARIYQAMKPAEAAVVFEQLEMDVQMKVAQRMRERATAMILAKMTPKGAASLTMALARKKAAGAAVAAAGPVAGAKPGTPARPGGATANR